MGEVLVLGAFLPAVVGMAGNVGVQSATVAVRGLATGTIDVCDVLNGFVIASRICNL